MKKMSVLIITMFCFALVLSSAETYSDGNGLIYSISGGEDKYIVIEGCDDVFITLEIPEEIEGLPVREIAENAFAGEERITKVILPNSVSKIGREAFAGSIKLREVILPSSLEEIPESCFAGCVQLRAPILPSSLEKIGDFAFINCIMIGKLKIPPSLVYIGYDAFASCESLIFDCGENKYALTYAKENHIDTSFYSSSTFSLIAGVLISIPIVSIVFALIRMRGKNKKTRGSKLY